MSERPTNTDDVIDSRDVIAAIAELRDLIAGGEDELGEPGELDALEAFAAEAAEVTDWEYGETFIHDAYFQTYAQQLAEDIGASDSEARWPACHIDWEAATDALRGDYTAYDFDGSTYWARA